MVVHLKANPTKGVDMATVHLYSETTKAVDAKHKEITMKPHFGQSDAAMNKLAGCNHFPNARKGLEQIAELEQKARDAGFATPLEYLRSIHEDAAGMPLDNRFYKQFFTKPQSAKNLTDLMTPLPLSKGYFGHEDGCDCAVCDDMAMRDSLRTISDGEFNKLLDHNAELIKENEELKANIQQVEQTAINFHEAWSELKDALKGAHVVNVEAQRRAEVAA